MGRGVQISFGGTVVTAELNESPTAALVWEALPIEGEAHRWGDEIYFSIPVAAALDDTAREVVELGDMGYWPTGQALCIFFGPTPVSQSGEIRPASPVNIVGKITGDPYDFKKATEGVTVHVEQ